MRYGFGPRRGQRTADLAWKPADSSCSRGFSVLLGARDITLGRDAANLLARGVRCAPMQLDIEDPEDIERLAAELEGQPRSTHSSTTPGSRSATGPSANVANRTIDVDFLEVRSESPTPSSAASRRTPTS